MVKRLWEGANGWNQQPKWSRVRLPTSEVKSFLKIIKEDFRTRLPSSSDRRMGLVSELFVSWVSDSIRVCFSLFLFFFSFPS